MDLSPVIPLAIVAGLGGAAVLARDVLRRDTGTDRMREIAAAIQDGARAFLRRQYRAIAIIAAILAVLFASSIGATAGWDLGLKTAGAFALGATFSALSGYLGMHIAIRSNVRSAAGSLKSFNDALVIALRGGAVSGLAIVGLSLAGITILYYGYSWGTDTSSEAAQTQVVLSLVGFGFGASLVALFAQLGGGIYTKAADVGADLVGKVEAGIPEDDPRNPAVIADLVGDNVGDCAGRGADLFESTAAENVGAMVLGVVLFRYFGIAGILFPLIARSFGVFASIIGVYVVRAREDETPMSALNRGYIVTTVLAAAFFGFAAWAMLQPAAVDVDGATPGIQLASPDTWIFYWFCGILGMITAFAYVWITQYYTEARYRPVKEIAKSSETGPATNIISGFAVGLEATWLPVLVVSAALLLAYWLGTLTLLPQGGLYGTAIATMGMLATAAYILAMDTFGPIVDNGAGIIEMSGMSEDARKNMDKLDAAGNTTKALTKGYAVGSAALAAFLLFSAYLTEAKIASVDMAKPEVFVGGFIGAALVFLFSAYAIRAVGRAAWSIIKDVRDQFRERPGIMAGTEKPDYGRTVDICTRSALKEMVVPGVLAVATPVAVGLLFRFAVVTPGLRAAEPLGGTLMVGTIAGVLMALVFNTGGGAWDNAKKFIEAGNLGGKGSPTHKAAVVGDTVGDPFKDTAGPSLHILVKLLSTITLVLVPLLA
ncbi:MAG: sodium-translocating pyrophosphatase [Euryarchaeota archaeon RBG_16_68_13]|nr:MAG: sodium-translocating pyrophosphatase [Euryarchaeota archaeon RBG_16_68_13]